MHQDDRREAGGVQPRLRDRDAEVGIAVAQRALEDDAQLLGAELVRLRALDHIGQARRFTRDGLSLLQAGFRLPLGDLERQLPDPARPVRRMIDHATRPLNEPVA